MLQPAGPKQARSCHIPGRSWLRLGFQNVASRLMGPALSSSAMGTMLSVASPRMTTAPDLARHWEQHMQLHFLPHSTQSAQCKGSRPLRVARNALELEMHGVGPVLMAMAMGLQ